MNKQERERSKQQRERIRQHRLWLAKRLVGCGMVLLTAVLLVSLIGSLFSQKENPALPAQAGVLSGPESDLESGISVDWSSGGQTRSSNDIGSEPEPQGYQQLSDPLLVLVNKDVPLPDNWQTTLVYITEDSDIQIDTRMYEDFCDMWRAASEDNAVLWVASGYRSVSQQETVLRQAIEQRMNWNGMSEEEARNDAMRTINRPGYSEHHTGLAIDFNDVDSGFEETGAYAWLSQHATEYGFVQRYKKSKVEFTGIDNESWHYRYVGKEHAKEMERLGMCLEEYVEYVKGSA